MGFLSVLFFAGFALASGDSLSVTISEPGRMTLHSLFEQADVVALVEVKGGDSGHYDGTVYRSIVEVSIKGTKAKETIYFGPYVGYGVGKKYLVALRVTSRTVGQPTSSDGPGFDSAAPLFAIMSQGYSVMPIEYTCDIPGCTEGVLYAPDYVVMPDAVPVFSSNCQCGASGKSWVKLSDLLADIQARGGKLPNSTIQPTGAGAPAADR